ncbi:MAG: hypothetical protein WDZ45_04845 [Flavobacteriaceae bacterium]
MYYKKLIVSSIMITMMFSCNSHKTTSENDSNLKNDKLYLENGFRKAAVIYSEIEGDCPYTISVEGESTLFDPINLEDEYKKSQATIWVKYHPLKMANRCNKANPVQITEIAKRD